MVGEAIELLEHGVAVDLGVAVVLAFVLPRDPCLLYTSDAADDSIRV